MNPNKDIFELSKKQALLTWAISQQECLVLRNTNFPRVRIPDSYQIKTFFPKRSQKTIDKKLSKLLDPLAKKYAGITEEYLGFQASVYEALLNTYQHGNQRDDSKKIIMANKITPKKVEIIVQDQGGILDPIFGLFVIQKRLRRGKIAKDFYEFANRFINRKRQKGNEGRGTHYNA